MLDHWRYKMLDSLPAAKADVDVGFARADAANVAIWKDATLVFCNSTCFSDSVRASFGVAWSMLAFACGTLTLLDLCSCSSSSRSPLQQVSGSWDWFIYPADLTHPYMVPEIDQLSDGTYFVTITKPLTSKRWKTMLEQKLDMSWGKATVIVQKKVF